MRIKFTSVLSLLLLFFSFSSYATIFRINNTLPTDKAQKIYNTIKEAHDEIDVAAGDTLMIEGSATIYAGLTMSKRLVLMGPGYLLSDNPQTQANLLQAVVQNITIGPTASGSILMGLTFSSGNTSYTPVINANNVIVMRCYLPFNIHLVGQLMNVQILQNFFLAAPVTVTNTSYSFTGVELRNNIIGGNISIASSTTTQRVFSVVENNVFLGNITLTASTFRNNIIVNSNSVLNLSSNTIQNNLVSNNQIPATNGNQTYNQTELFVGPTGNSPDGQYKLKENSPYKTAGFGNVEPGVYGGSHPYMLSGVPPVPSIYELNAPSFGSRQNGLPVSIKVRANQ